MARDNFPNLFGHIRADGKARKLAAEALRRESPARCHADGCDGSDTRMEFGHIVPFAFNGLSGLNADSNVQGSEVHPDRTIADLMSLTHNGAPVGYSRLVATAIVTDGLLPKSVWDAEAVRSGPVKDSSGTVLGYQYRPEFDLNGAEVQCHTCNRGDNKARLNRANEVRHLAAARYRHLGGR